MSVEIKKNVLPESVSEDTTRGMPSEYRQTADASPKRITPLTCGSMSSAWPWPDDLEAVVAVPRFHTALFEDDRVRVLDGHVPPGAMAPVHTDRWAGVPYFLGSSDLVRRDPDWNVLADTRASKASPIAGTAVWGVPLYPDAFQNVGNEEFRTLTVEMKGGGGNHAYGAT